ncbi:MAG: elongation factor P maturation arginine rhamnosyltransferase EarP [Candidatus Delongbacteria bacterium]|nr:elongation factor P maturation arginine rhamnosyltransferase EarP [Candidatus Delongbacteria bacterium]
MKIGSIDIFCDVIDNFGDAGVCLRLARSLKSRLPGSEIRIFTNDLSAFAALDGEIGPDKEIQYIRDFSLLSYTVITEKFVEELQIPQAVIEAFACHIPELYYNKALESDCVIINLDHLSAEKWIEGVHLKESLTGRRAKKYFFMPGFNGNSGGLILDTRLSDEEAELKRSVFLKRFGLKDDGLLLTVFTYEHDFRNLISDIKSSGRKTNVVVFGEKSRSSIEPLLELQDENLSIVLSDFLDQDEYTDLIKVSDLNFVRGEDSWARACLSGKPFIWHAYHQEKNYQLVKVKAFLETVRPYFESIEIYDHYSEYLIRFNDRSVGIKDVRFSFMQQNQESLKKMFKLFSGYLFKNCNLTENLLKFLDMQK